MSNEVPASTAAAVSSNNFYDPFLLQPQSLCIYPYSSQPASPAAIYDAPSQFAFPLQNCPPQSFTFSPTGIQGSALHWQSIESVHEGVLTPTNVNGTFTEFGAVASATPEFIHPRNSNVPQWLMSPPVGDQDPSIISYAPLNTPTHSTALTASENGDVSTVLFNKDSPKKIFPIGVFWDIENCQVPSGKSSLAIVQKIRRQFFNDHVEAEFMAVCDINKESRHVIQDLNNAQVNVIHVNAVAKNAADDKLRQS
uniref:NYN domain-containing protein n=1 Tax=Ciona savignyi TaxID=51511 RepID=H2Z5V1_CIOSA